MVRRGGAWSSGGVVGWWGGGVAGGRAFCHSMRRDPLARQPTSKAARGTEIQVATEWKTMSCWQQKFSDIRILGRRDLKQRPKKYFGQRQNSVVCIYSRLVLWVQTQSGFNVGQREYRQSGTGDMATGWKFAAEFWESLWTTGIGKRTT